MDADLPEERWQQVTIAGCLLTAVGSFPGWFTVSRLSVADGSGAVMRRSVIGGFDGDGVFTLTFAGIAGLAVFYRAVRPAEIPRFRAAAVTFVAGLAAAAIAGFTLVRLWVIQSEPVFTVSIAWATYAVLVGVGALVAGGVLGLLGGDRHEADVGADGAADPD